MSATSPRDKNFFQKAVDTNFAKLLGIELTDIQPESLTLQMPLNIEEHNNASGFVHGGVIMSLADTAMGCACFYLGKRVTTLDLNINFIKGARPTGHLKAVANVIHNGSRTMVAEAELYDTAGAFIAKARGTFFVIGVAEDWQPATS